MIYIDFTNRFSSASALAVLVNMVYIVGVIVITVRLFYLQKQLQLHKGVTHS